jgi:hypothetical protein
MRVVLLMIYRGTSPSRFGRGWREAPGEGGPDVTLSLRPPSSSASRHLLPEGEGL